MSGARQPRPWRQPRRPLRARQAAAGKTPPSPWGEGGTPEPPQGGGGREPEAPANPSSGQRGRSVKPPQGGWGAIRPRQVAEDGVSGGPQGGPPLAAMTPKARPAAAGRTPKQLGGQHKQDAPRWRPPGREAAGADGKCGAAGGTQSAAGWARPLQAERETNLLERGRAARRACTEAAFESQRRCAPASAAPRATPPSKGMHMGVGGQDNCRRCHDEANYSLKVDFSESVAPVAKQLFAKA